MILGRKEIRQIRAMSFKDEELREHELDNFRRGLKFQLACFITAGGADLIPGVA